MTEAQQHEEGLVPIETQPVAGLIARAELDMAIVTAREYPRNIQQFQERATTLAIASEDMAEQCWYSLPRGKETIEGPTARLAEIVHNSYGNCVAGARIIEEAEEYLVAQGVFHDLETNSRTCIEVRRSIKGKNGNRYPQHMIDTTANAAISIALRNAVFKGVPKAFWEDIYKQARRVGLGDETTLPERRQKAIEYLAKWGIDETRILRRFGADTVEDIDLTDLAALRGVANALRDGDILAHEAFPDPSERERRMAKHVATGGDSEPQGGDSEPDSVLSDDDIPT